MKIVPGMDNSGVCSLKILLMMPGHIRIVDSVSGHVRKWGDLGFQVQAWTKIFFVWRYLS
jgi:hypothetical protein